jgi:ubiquinone biosynthesis accessory factor UbiK
VQTADGTNVKQVFTTDAPIWSIQLYLPSPRDCDDEPSEESVVIDLRNVEAFAERIAVLLPADPRGMRDEFKNTVKPLIEATLNRMDVVTREEFEAQTLVLRKTREKLETLERALAELEDNGARG